MFRKVRALTFVSLSLTWGAFGMYAQGAITISNPRPLGELVSRLNEHGYLVTYEEAPYDPESELSTRVYPDGTRFRAPASVPVAFHLPAAIMPSRNAIASASPSLQDLGFIKESVREYNESGNPGSFNVLFEGKYAHIVPAERKVKGNRVPFDPILSTKVVLAPQPRLCEEAMHDLFKQLRLLRDVTVVQGSIPMNSLLRHTCAVVGNDLTARQVLIQILAQMVDNPNAVLSEPPVILAWELYYDANWNEYFLSTAPVRPARATNANSVVATPEKAPDTTQPSSASPGVSFGANHVAAPAPHN